MIIANKLVSTIKIIQKIIAEHFKIHDGTFEKVPV